MKNTNLNDWQKAYLRIYFDGKMPRSKSDKDELALLGTMKSKVIVEIPEFNGKPAHTEQYTIRDGACDMPNGFISVEVLASNLKLWASRGWTVKTT